MQSEDPSSPYIRKRNYGGKQLGQWKRKTREAEGRELFASMEMVVRQTIVISCHNCIFDVLVYWKVNT